MTLGKAITLLNHGIVTPSNSQEPGPESDNDTPVGLSLLALRVDTQAAAAVQAAGSVDWLDTDSSEDEDYLPQSHHRHFPSPARRAMAVDEEDEEEATARVHLARKRGRLPAAQPPEQHRRRRMNVHEQPEMIGTTSSAQQQERVRRAIDAAIDNGEDYVDLSHLALTEVPDEITELKYVTVLRKDRIKKSSLKLFLYGNSLTQLPPCLFTLKNLSVLSLRHNLLSQLPHEIGLLQNLVELSVGNNQLAYLPAEVLKLPRLETMCLSPNPFVRPTSPVDPRHVISTIPSLVEITSRHLLTAQNNDARTAHQYIMPYELHDRLQSVLPMSRCFHCQQPFYKPSVEAIVWQELFGTPSIPLLYRFCSNRCYIANS